MKALVLQKFGNPHGHFELTEMKTPEVGANDVLIEVQYSGVNFADILAGKGLYRATPPLPCVIGYEVVGKVMQIGEKVQHLAKGTNVAAFTAFNGYASHAVVNVSQAHPLPADFDPKIGCSLLAQGCTAVYAADFIAQQGAHAVCLVQSATGGLGQILTQLLQNQGMEVHGTTTSKEKVNELQQQGVIGHHVPDLKRYAAILSETKPTLIFDCMGGNYFRAGLTALPAGGQVITYGAASRNNDNAGLIGNLKTLFGFGWLSPLKLLGNSNTVSGLNLLKVGQERPELLQLIFETTLDYAQSGKLNIKIDKVFPASEADQAHLYMNSKQSKGKLLLEW